MTEAYAKALLAVKARELHNAILGHLPFVTDAIEAHKLAEICADCAWCEKNYQTED